MICEGLLELSGNMVCASRFKDYPASIAANVRPATAVGRCAGVRATDQSRLAGDHVLQVDIVAIDADVIG